MITAKAILSSAFLESVQQMSVFGGELFKVLRKITNDYFDKNPISTDESPVFQQIVSDELKKVNTDQPIVKIEEKKTKPKEKVKPKAKEEKKVRPVSSKPKETLPKPAQEPAS